MRAPWNYFRSSRRQEAQINCRLESLSLVTPAATKIFAATFLFFILTASVPAQTNSASPGKSMGAVNFPTNQFSNVKATAFTLNQYYEPPDDRQMEMKMTGASTSPLPDGVQDIRDLRIEYYNKTNVLKQIVIAPQCNYSMFDGIASSAGHLEIRTGDGGMVTTGDGFWWRMDDNLLIISNNVHTVIKAGAMKSNIP